MVSCYTKCARRYDNLVQKLAIRLKLPLLQLLKAYVCAIVWHTMGCVSRRISTMPQILDEFQTPLHWGHQTVPLYGKLSAICAFQMGNAWGIFIRPHAHFLMNEP
eukprot:1156061-Pelagomonas_calceolata.AAC.2